MALRVALLLLPGLVKAHLRSTVELTVDGPEFLRPLAPPAQIEIEDSMLVENHEDTLLLTMFNAHFGGDIVELTADNFDKFVHENPKVMIDFMDSSSEDYEQETSELTDAIHQLRLLQNRVPVARVDYSKYPDLVKRFMQVGCSDSDVSGAQLCGNKLPQLMWFRNGKATEYHKSLWSRKWITTFVLLLDREPVTTLKEEPRDLKDFGVARAVLAKMPQGSPELKVLEEVAEQYMDSVSFMHVDSEDKSISWILNGSLTDYFTDAVEASAVARWVRVHVAMSEEAPAEPLDEGSLVVVGRTFDELVMRRDRDVMLLAYAPWCGFSRKVMPVWAEFAHKATSAQLVVAKMDASRNRSPTLGFSWTTFPQIIFVRKGETSAILFNSTNRTVETFMEFARRHSSEPLAFDSAIALGNETEL